MKQPAFQKPEWRFYGAEEVVDYFVTDGKVSVVPESSEDYSVAVAVPVEFVKFLHDMGIHDSVVHLYLDQQGRRWVFGYQLPGTQECVDLWHYTANSFPLWAESSRRLT
jgi:hypothetical protein